MKVKIVDIVVPEYRQRTELKKIDFLAASITEYGLLQPVVLSKNKLMAGLRRLTAVKSLGWDEVEAVQLGDLNEVVQQEVELEENVRREALTWQEKVRAFEKIYNLRKARGEGLKEITQSLGIPMATFFDGLQLARAVREMPGIARATTAHQAQKLLKTIRERAVIAELAHRGKGKKKERKFVNDDCLKFLLKLPPESVDIAAFDPPFALNIEEVSKYGLGAYGKIYRDNPEEVLSTLEEAIPLIYRVMKPNSHLYMFFAVQHYQPLYMMLKAAGFDIYNSCMYWVKSNSPGQSQRPEKWPGSAVEPMFFAHKGFKPLVQSGKPNYFYEPVLASQRKSHPLEKPVSLWRNILARSAIPGERVLDPFAGTGSCLLAAKISGLDYCGCEIDTEYWAIGQRLLEEIKV